MIDNRIYLAGIFLRDNLLIFTHRDIQDILIISKVLTHVIYIRIGASVDNIRHYGRVCWSETIQTSRLISLSKHYSSISRYSISLL